MIKICKNKKIYTLDDVSPEIEPMLVDLDKVDPNKFVTACLAQSVILEEGLTVEELMQFFSLCRDFIYEYFNDYYDRYQSLISSQQVGKKYQEVRVFKKLTVDRGYIFIEPSVDFIKYKDSDVHKNDRPDFLTQIPIRMENELVIQQDDISSDIDKLMEGLGGNESEVGNESRIEGTYKMEFTLLELMEAFLTDLIYSIEESRL